MEDKSTCAETKSEEKYESLKTILEHVKGLEKMASCPREEFVVVGSPRLLINQTSGTLARLSRASWVRRRERFLFRGGTTVHRAFNYAMLVGSAWNKAVNVCRMWP
jgi:hypothetical protein